MTFNKERVKKKRHGEYLWTSDLPVLELDKSETVAKEVKFRSQESHSKSVMRGRSQSQSESQSTITTSIVNVHVSTTSKPSSVNHRRHTIPSPNEKVKSRKSVGIRERILLNRPLGANITSAKNKIKNKTPDQSKSREERAKAVEAARMERKKKRWAENRRRRIENPFEYQDKNRRDYIYGRSAEGRSHFRREYSYSTRRPPSQYSSDEDE